MDSVKANACCLSRAQAGAESFCRPGMWLPGVRNLHLATETWEIKAALNVSKNACVWVIDVALLQDTINAVVEGAVRVGEKENMEVHKVDKLELLVELWSFTPGCNWMDVVEIRFKNGDPASGKLTDLPGSGTVPLWSSIV